MYQNFKVQPQALTGSQSPAARFGSAISTLGDINGDTYNGMYISFFPTGCLYI